MPDVNLYLGAFTGTQIDGAISRVNDASGSGALPVMWQLELIMLDELGSSGTGYCNWNETTPSGDPTPNLNNCEILKVFVDPGMGNMANGITHDWYFRKLSIVQTDTRGISVNWKRNKTGDVAVVVYLVDKSNYFEAGDIITPPSP